MKITEIETIPLAAELQEPIWDAQHYIPKRQALIIKVYTDQGLIGLGESASFGGPIETTKAVIDKELKNYFIGKDPFDVERLWDDVYKGTVQHGRRGIVIAALSGIDIALWDLIGKATNKPVYKILGGYRDEVEAYASSGFYSEGRGLPQLAHMMETYVKEGFKTVKMKVGGMSAKDDLKRVQAVREAVGDEIGLAVDANSNWDLPTALWMAKQLEPFNIKWIEEPLMADDVTGTAKLANSTVIPIAGYEQDVTRYAFMELIKNQAVYYLQPDAIWAGGISECKKIAALALANHLAIMPHVFSSGVCLAANLHFIASTANAHLLELDRNENPLRDELIHHSLIHENGRIKLPDSPGLGIELNEEVIRKYTVS
ncbi:mandelate racemase/muconate lactonizing enzyme family protein [Alkalihalobacillus oceani]|uniref:mandelate racemase/muconate lactonizing enzyme family protein n=1 Tax=Halalkalibacter oceani TaxID=1653776 RepID=UPI00203A4CB8|nr:mandelate racemase/muconate lactonizing enzyme family protein [Halalkalibacter oceani]MCM3759992.1 mandelate racemase/muconate lactonizing enzyme family protein [Halalkalibacter oceani]